MKPLSERIKEFPANQFVDWICLSCVDVREVSSEEDAQDEINKIRKAVTERLAGLEQQRDALAENEGYKQAFYEIAQILGIGARPDSPKDVYEQVIKPMLMNLHEERGQLAAENAILKNGIGFFSYGTDSGFEEHESAEKAIAAADSDIDYYRGDACDGWSEETDQTVWGVIMQRATTIDERPRSEEFPDGSCDYALLPILATPATDAYLNSVRAEGVEMFAELHDAIAENYRSESPGCYGEQLHQHASSQAVKFAAQLRAGKDGE